MTAPDPTDRTPGGLCACGHPERIHGVLTDPLQAVLDGIRDEVRDAVLEGDAQDCQSADCIADAVYEIVRVRLRAAIAADTPGLDVDALLDRIDALPRLDHDGADWVQLSDVLAAVKWWALAARLTEDRP